MLRDHFKPEFLNRIDDIVVFKQLTRDQIATDHRRPAREAAKELSRNAGSRSSSTIRPGTCSSTKVTIRFTVHGRLKRAIQTLIQNPLAVSLLKGEIA